MLFISYRRRLVGLCVLQNWFTERNCLIFSDVSQKEARKKNTRCSHFQDVLHKEATFSTWKSDQTQQSTIV